MKIPISEPFVNGNEFDEIKNVLKKNEISSYGKIIGKFEKKICGLTNIKFAVACSSGTAALHTALKVIGVKKNDEVLVPTITFIATINAIKYIDAIPVFFGCDKFFNINDKAVVKFIKKNTYIKKGNTYNKKTNRRIAAIIPVHVWGNAANIQEISKICKKRNIKVLEDASEALGTCYNNRKSVGSLGDIGVFSFNGNKIVTTGHGGVIVTNKKSYETKSRYLISQATDDNEKFIHNEVGYNYRFSGINAAFGLGQLKKFNFYLNQKKKINKTYKKLLNSTPNFKILSNPSYSKNNNWINILQFNPKLKNKVIKTFKKNKIQTKLVWFPNHLQKSFRKNEKFEINNLNKFYKGSICLPSSVNMKKKDIIKIVEVIKKI